MNRRFAAEDIKDVIDKLPELLTENEELYAIIDENPIFIFFITTTSRGAVGDPVDGLVI